MKDVARGFILQPTYRIEGGRAVIHLFGKLEGGGSFLVRESRRIPRFYVRAADAERARELGARPLEAEDKVSMAGEPVLRVDVPLPGDTPKLRHRLEEAGIACMEADVRFVMRFLMDHGIRGAMEIRGPSRREPGVGRVFEDPEVAPAAFSPPLSTLSLDIETDPRARRLLSVGLVGCGTEEVLLLTPWGKACPPPGIPFRTEGELIAALCRRVRELDPDVITGWNVIDFDLKTLARLAASHGTALELGRGPGGMRIQAARSVWGSAQAQIPGRVVLDALHLLRGAFVRMEDYTLDAVARELLGEGKTVGGHGRAEEILRLFEHERFRFVDYNLTDARLVLAILEKLRLVELAVERSLLTGMPLDRVSAAIASVEYLYMTEMGRRGIVAPTAHVEGEAEMATEGGHVLEPRAGLYENVLVFDFKSLYPSIIRTFQIDPVGYRPGGSEGDDVVVTPGGGAFRREEGILPLILTRLFREREAAKLAGENIKSNAIKILMNSFYGALGSSACRFHNPDIANAITGSGRELLLWCRGRMEHHGHEVLYGDTDSLFVTSGEGDPACARSVGARLVESVNLELSAYLRQRHGVESHLELELETVYLKLFLPHARHVQSGARKRYVGIVEEGEGRQVVFTGMEAVRRDWTDAARRVQRELYARLFDGREVADFLSRVVAQLRAGELDEELVYRKALRKKVDEYTVNVPPHVEAARKMNAAPGKLISYLITTAGPEPLGERAHPIDREHYVQKQLRPVAEPVLENLGLDFDRVVGDDRQLLLFPPEG